MPRTVMPASAIALTTMPRAASVREPRLSAHQPAAGEATSMPSDIVALGELVEDLPRPQRAGERERDVEPEHPLPAQADQHAAEHRPENQADRGDHRVRAHRDAELLARERVGDQRAGIGEEERATD